MKLSFTFKGNKFTFTEDDLLQRIHCRLSSSEYGRDFQNLVKVWVAADIWRTFAIDVSDRLTKSGGEIAYIPVTYDFIAATGFTLEKIEAAAYENDTGDIYFKSMNELIGLPWSDDDPLYVVTNTAQTYGASRILDENIQNILRQRYPKGCYILPASVHEVIVLSKVGAPVITLAHIVREINRTTLNPHEILSDHVFEFNGETITAAA